MPLIKREFIHEKLMPQINIEEVIGRYLTLKRSGSNYICCCPFHHEKTPSFTVTPSKQMFYCFGCKEHGNAIDFIMKYKNVPFYQAVEELAEFAGIPLEYEQGRSSSFADRYKLFFELMDRAASAFTKALNENPRAMEYFTKKRGLSRDIIIKDRLGYAPAGWDFIKNIARDSTELSALETVGLLTRSQNGKTYDFFRDRVIIPIVDRRGHIVSFGGRTLGDDKPKYLNTAETPIYQKRRELFGLYQTLEKYRNRPERFVVVEGYMDVISLQQAGIDYAVASLGTATTEEHFKLMFRYSKLVICCYDGDNAGRMAAWHALQTVTPVMQPGVEIRFAFLPPEHDPDSMVRELGPAAFLKVLDEAISYPEFLIEHLKLDYDLADLGQRTSFISAALHSARLISYQPLQAMVIERLSQQVGVETERLYRMLDQVVLSKEEMRRQEGAVRSEDPQKDDGRRYLTTPMRKLIAFLLQQPTVTAAVYQQFRLDELCTLMQSLKLKGADDAVFLLHTIRDNGALTPGTLIEIMRGTPREQYSRKLIDAEFIPKRADGSEFSMEDRAELLAKLIFEVLREALKRFAEELKYNREEDLGRSEMLLMTELNRLLSTLKL